MRRFAPILSDALQWIVIALACLMAVTRPAKGAAEHPANRAMTASDTGLMNP